jgi:hypothetical protein
MGKGNQSELAAQQVRLEQDEVGSKYPTYVAVAEGQEQQKLDKAIVKGLDPKLRVKVLSPAEALDAGYKVGKGCGGFENLWTRKAWSFFSENSAGTPMATAAHCWIAM